MMAGLRKTEAEGSRGTKAEETQRKSMFILLKGEEILVTNYSCAYAARPLVRGVWLYLED